ncbi:MAG: PKD repeat protein [Bacteriovoracaceae bacterium]|jgi:PKD repeat protein
MIKIKDYMNYLFLLLSFFTSTVFATPTINLQYSNYVLTGEKIEVDASSSTDSNGLRIRFEWELISSPSSSQSQIMIEDEDKISFTSDREGIYTFKIRAISEDGSELEKYFSLYTKNSSGEVIYGPETRSVNFLCKLTFRIFGCDTDTFQFSIPTPDDSYSLQIDSNNIDRGILNVNDEQVVHFFDHAGGNDKFVKEIGLQISNNISADMIASNIAGDYTVTISKQNLPVDTNLNAPTASDMISIATLGSEVILQLDGEDSDGDEISYHVLQKPLYGTYDLTNQGQFKYTARAFNMRVDEVIISVRDNGVPSKESIFKLNFQITNNQAPIILAENMSSNTETVSQMLTVLDDPAQTLTKSISRNPSNGIVIFDTTTNLVTYLSNSGFTGTDSFEISVIDNGSFNLESKKVIVVEVFPNNLPQVLGSTNFTIQENTIQQLEIRAIDPDLSQELISTILQNPSNGSLQAINDFDYIYSPNQDFFGNDSFVVEFRDNANPNGVLVITYNFEIEENGNNPPVFNGLIDTIARNDFSPIQMEMFLSEIPTDNNGVQKIVWHFGDGNSRELDFDADGQDANGYNIHFYENAGEYDVSVEIHDSLGAIKFFSQTINITSDMRPVAKIIPSTYSGSAPLTVTFDGSSSHDHGETDALNLYYFWDLAGDIQDGENLSQVTKTFTTAGTYEVYLDVIDGGVRRSPRTITIYVDEPVGSLLPQIVLNSDLISGSSPLTVNFNASESIDAFGVNTGLTYKWNMRDIESVQSYGEGSAFTHTFNTPGTYNIELKVIDGAGNEAVEYKTIFVDNPHFNDFDFIFVDKVGLEVTGTIYPFLNHTPISERGISIDWGDGSKEFLGRATYFNHLYGSAGTYHVKITGELANGTVLSKTKTLIVEDTSFLPNMDLVSTEYAFVVPFDNTYLIQNQNYIGLVDITWLFAEGNFHKGDSNSDNSFQYTHITAGTKDTEVVVTLSSGFSTVKQVRVGASESNVPILNYNLGQCVGKAPFSTALSIVQDVIDPFTNVEWFFGGRNELYGGESLLLNFSNTGEFFPIVRARTMGNNFNIEGFPIQVNLDDPPIGNQAPIIDYEIFFDQIDPDVMSLELSNSNDSDGRIVCYQVSLGNGDSFTSRGFNRYRFPNNGTYDVTIEAFDNWGASTSETISVTVGQDVSSISANSVSRRKKLNNRKIDYFIQNRMNDVERHNYFHKIDRKSRGK